MADIDLFTMEEIESISSDVVLFIYVWYMFKTIVFKNVHHALMI